MVKIVYSIMIVMYKPLSFLTIIQILYFLYFGLVSVISLINVQLFCILNIK